MSKFRKANKGFVDTTFGLTSCKKDRQNGVFFDLNTFMHRIFKNSKYKTVRKRKLKKLLKFFYRSYNICDGNCGKKSKFVFVRFNYAVYFYCSEQCFLYFMSLRNR